MHAPILFLKHRLCNSIHLLLNLRCDHKSQVQHLFHYYSKKTCLEAIFIQSPQKKISTVQEVEFNSEEKAL